jgi:hypothetical protein
MLHMVSPFFLVSYPLVGVDKAGQVASAKIIFYTRPLDPALYDQHPSSKPSINAIKPASLTVGRSVAFQAQGMFSLHMGVGRRASQGQSSFNSGQPSLRSSIVNTDMYDIWARRAKHKSYKNITMRLIARCCKLISKATAAPQILQPLHSTPAHFRQLIEPG